MLTRETLIGLWAGLPVAWTQDDKFDEDTYRQDVARCCQAGVPGVYTGGTTGEFYAMEIDEWQAVNRATVEECRIHGVPVMIGCTSTYTLGAVRRAAFAAQIGADAIQVALPFWMAVEDAQVVPFFKEVSAACGHLPLSIYDISRTKKPLSFELHRAVKDALGNYMMVKSGKDTPGNSVEGCRKMSEFVNVFVGEHQWDTLGPAGANGCCSSRVYWNPRVFLKLWQDLLRRDWTAVSHTCKEQRRLNEFIHRQFGAKGFTDTAYDRLGGIACGFLKTSLRNRGPYVCPTETDVQEFRDWCQGNLPEMLEL